MPIDSCVPPIDLMFSPLSDAQVCSAILTIPTARVTNTDREQRIKTFTFGNGKVTAMFQDQPHPHGPRDIVVVPDHNSSDNEIVFVYGEIAKALARAALSL